MSETNKVAVRWPGAMGLKRRAMMQLEFTPTEAEQLLVKLKSGGLGPLREMEEIMSGALPELVTVRACDGLDVPCVVVGKEGTAGEKVAAGAGAMPVPLRTRVCGEAGALSATWRLAVSVPTAAGVKLMLTEQLALGARVARHVLVCEKLEAFAPAMEMELRASN